MGAVYYHESHRDEYYERLLAISKDGDWTGWCGFFLRAIISQAEVNQGRMQAILDLYRDKKEWITEQTRSQFAVKALDLMFERPIFKASDFIRVFGEHRQAASRILRICRDEKLLYELQPGSGRRSSVLCFLELLRLAEGLPIF